MVPEPRSRGTLDERIRKVARKNARCLQTELFLSVPDAIVRAGFCEMIARARASRVLLPDDGFENRGGFVYGAGVRIRALQYEHARAIAQHRRPFRLQCHDLR